jgi:secreted PhoX family phosphatase
VENPDPFAAELNPGAVFKQGHSKSGARFARLEGCWWDGNSLYFCSTSGGDASQGQIWEYRVAGSSGGQLVLVYESPGAEVMSFPDNITASPRGALVVCEDPLANDFHRLIQVAWLTAVAITGEIAAEQSRLADLARGGPLGRAVVRAVESGSL